MLTLGLAIAPGCALSALLAFVASAYLFFAVRALPPGWLRLAASLPVLALYVAAPRFVDPSHDTMATGVLFCVLTWLASFRVLSFCWAEGILMEPFANRDVLRFHACLAIPIHLRPAGWQPRRVRRRKDGADNGKGVLQWLVGIADSDTWPVLVARSGLKFLVMVLLFPLYDLKESFPYLTLQALHAINLFLFVTLVLEALAAVMQLLLGMPVEPHFDQPYLASSLEDFWSRRWNLLISGLLRDTIYHPLLRLLTSQNAISTTETSVQADTGKFPPNALENSRNPDPTIGKQRGEECPPIQRGVQGSLRHRGTPSQSAAFDPPASKVTARAAPLWARLVAMLASFFVSGIMHELAVFYLSGKVTGEMTAFFTLHGIATALEAVVKSLMKGKAGLPRVLAIPFTVGFTFLTAQRLFFGPLVSLGVDQNTVKNVRRLLGI